MRVLLALLLACAACDQLNKPLGHPQSTSGSSSGSSTPTETTDADGGSASDHADGGAAPAYTAQPGDIQL